ncbi:MAG: cytochrome b [Gemmatimonadales bacterium]|nr:MAG: cytochrome b [Gemmatimonadales bacterium]
MSPPQPSPMPRHHPITRLFHWVIAALVFVMIPVGIAMTSEGFAELRNQLFILHKGLGTVLLVLVALRILWRLLHKPPPPPPTMSLLQRRLAGLTHGFLYVLLVVMTVTGYVRVVGGGFPIELLDRFGIPTLLPEMPVWADRMSVLHKFTAYLLTGAIAAHIAAAVHHALFEKDGIMSRIWPPVGGRG